jgi:hypothetical protein
MEPRSASKIGVKPTGISRLLSAAADHCAAWRRVSRRFSSAIVDNVLWLYMSFLRMLDLL